MGPGATALTRIPWVCVLARRRFGQADHSVFGRDIAGEPTHRFDAGRRGHVHDGVAAGIDHGRDLVFQKRKTLRSVIVMALS
jgi:hypothetical protein